MNPTQDHSVKADILVVDDQPANLRLLVKILTEQGYKVRPVLDGNLAIEAVQASPPDLILLDILMPSIDGYRVCEKLKANPQTCDIPVIFLSALNEGFDKAKAFQVGGVDYIAKPFQVEEILARVTHQLTLNALKIQLQQRNKELIEQSLNLQWLLCEKLQKDREINLFLDTTRAVSLAEDLDSALDVVLGLICKAIQWDLAEAWIPKSNDILKCSRGRYAKDASLSEFRQQTWSLTFRKGNELPGQIFSTQKAQWIQDVSILPTEEFQRSKIAAEVGLKAGFGVPILGRNKVLAIIIFYSRESSPLQSHLIELVEAVATQLGSLFQRKKAESELIQANRELERLANLDGLTGVANRRHFDAYLEQEWYRLSREQKPLSLILCDVDYFKQYNDHYGHQAGDDCLKSMAEVICDVAKRPADLVARYGGEEFVILLPNTDVEGARQVATVLQLEVQRLAIPHAASQVSSYITLSLGISSLIPCHHLRSDILVATADEALYEAKNQGRNRICVHSSIIYSF